MQTTPLFSLMRHLWLNECMGFSVDYVKNAVKLRISVIHKQVWSDDIENNSVCSYYAKVKNLHCIEPYLLELNFRDRCTVAQFRCRSNYLPTHNTKLPHIEVHDICPFVIVIMPTNVIICYIVLS